MRPIRTAADDLKERAAAPPKTIQRFLRHLPCKSRGYLVLSCVLLAAMVACDPTVKVEGAVHDSQGKPLEGVTVILQSEGRQPHQTVTAKDGSFGLGIVGAEPSQTKLVFQKEGYIAREQPLSEAHISNLQVVLETK